MGDSYWMADDRVVYDTWVADSRVSRKRRLGRVQRLLRRLPRRVRLVPLVVWEGTKFLVVAAWELFKYVTAFTLWVTWHAFRFMLAMLPYLE